MVPLADGGVVVSDSDNNRVKVFNGQGELRLTIECHDGERIFRNPRGLATDGEFLFVSDSSHHCIRKMRLEDGEPIVSLGSQGSCRGALAYCDAYSLPYGPPHVRLPPYPPPPPPTATTHHHHPTPLPAPPPPSTTTTNPTTPCLRVRCSANPTTPHLFSTNLNSTPPLTDEFSHPEGLALSCGRLIVADKDNNRLVCLNADTLTWAFAVGRFGSGPDELMCTPRAAAARSPRAWR